MNEKELKAKQVQWGIFGVTEKDELFIVKVHSQIGKDKNLTLAELLRKILKYKWKSKNQREFAIHLISARIGRIDESRKLFEFFTEEMKLFVEGLRQLGLPDDKIQQILTRTPPITHDVI